MLRTELGYWWWRMDWWVKRGSFTQLTGVQFPCDVKFFCMNRFFPFIFFHSRISHYCHRKQKMYLLCVFNTLINMRVDEHACFMQMDVYYYCNNQKQWQIMWYTVFDWALGALLCLVFLLFNTRLLMSVIAMTTAPSGSSPCPIDC